MTCGEMDMLVHPFLDGELVDEERMRIVKHTAGCTNCRALLHHEATFRQNLRARLRPRPGLDVVPVGLRQNVMAALDRADATGDGPARPLGRAFAVSGRFLAPALGALATAAAIALFFRPDFGSLGKPSGATDGLVEQAIAGHRKNLPVEVGGTDDEIMRWMAGKVPVAVRPPRLEAAHSRPSTATFATNIVGARISHLGNRDAGQIVYRVRGSQLTVYVFDPSGVDIVAQRHRLPDGREVFIAEQAGYSVIFYRDRGVGYAVTSDLDEDLLLSMVTAALQEEPRR